MPATITDIQTVVGTFQALDAKGNPTAPGGPLVVTVGDPTIATGATIDATTFSIVGVKPGSCPVQVTDGVATAQDVVTVTGSAEASASIAFGAPTP